MPMLINEYPYSSVRIPTVAGNVVATSQPLAAQAGLRALHAGGNAMDAALAAAIALTVVEPTSNGIGGDAFAIVWDGNELHGLNASGRSPAALSPEHFAGQEKVSLRGWDPVTVPGAVAAWRDLSARFGKLPFSDLFTDAIRYAERGFHVSPWTAVAWQRAPKAFADYPEFAKTFLPDGQAPKFGDVVTLPDHARTLRTIASSNGQAFYEGELAEKIAAHAANTGGFLTIADLAAHENIWSGTVSQEYHGVELHQIPPNGQGLAALIGLAILNEFDIREYEVDSADFFHLQIEAMKLALADAHRYICDPDFADTTVSELLNPTYVQSRAALIDMKQAQNPGHGTPERGGTVYVATGDDNGMMVSFIQSNYHGFGSGIVVPGTGIALQNRGAGFSLEAGHPNQVGPSKRPFHTIIPGFLTQNGQPLAAFGVMGGPIQAQGQLQVVVRMVDFGQNPQTASDAPRWQIIAGKEVAIERGVHMDVLSELSQRGHQLNLDNRLFNGKFFGGSQVVYRIPNGYVGATDWRRDGIAAGY